MPWITLHELRSVWLPMHQHFAQFVFSPEVTKALLHEDNQAVVYIFNCMVSASNIIMRELHQLEKPLHVLEVTIQARWLPE